MKMELKILAYITGITASITTWIKANPALYKWMSNPMNIVFLSIIVIMGVTILTKNKNISTLESKLEECINKDPIVEYVYNTDTITITETVPEPYYVHVNDTIVLNDTITIESDKEVILASYETLREQYYTTKKYDNILINDSSVFVALKEEVTENTLMHRELNYQFKGPKEIIKTYNVTHTYHTFSGGILAGTGGLFLGGLYTTPADNSYTVLYDPINKGFMAGAYFKIFKLKTK